MARRSDFAPALIFSAVAHAGLLALALIAWPTVSTNLQLGKVVPVTLVTGDSAEMAPAVKAPEPAPAMTPEPTPDAPAEPAPISPAPPSPLAPTAPAKAAAQSKPQEQTKTPSLKAAKAQASAKAANQGLDLDALMQSLNNPSQQPSTHASSGLQGANRLRTDVIAQEGHGADDHLSSSEIDALVSKLQKLWNPNCQVEGAAGINVKVHMRLTADGRLAVPAVLPDRGDIDSSGDPILKAAAYRALSAATRGAPYTELNPEHYAIWRDLTVNFNAKKACAR